MSEQTRQTKAAGALALTAATGAVACAACCVLPFALPAVALASVGSVVALAAGALPWIAGLAAMVVAAAWVWIGWQSQRSRLRPARSTLHAMGAATVLPAIAVAWWQLESMS